MEESRRHPQFSTKGMVAHYKLWAGITYTSKLFDYSNNGYLATVNGAGMLQSYPGFNVTATDALTVGTGPTSVSTVLMWINPVDVIGADAIVGINFTDSLNIDTGAITKTGFAGGTTVLYVDGLASSTVTANWHFVGITDTSAKNANACTFGGYVGKMGECMLFSTVLTPAEVKSIYELTKWRYPNN